MCPTHVLHNESVHGQDNSLPVSTLPQDLSIYVPDSQEEEQVEVRGAAPAAPVPAPAPAPAVAPAGGWGGGRGGGRGVGRGGGRGAYPGVTHNVVRD